MEMGVDDIFQISFDKKRLAEMPKEERTLLLLLGHAWNEILFLVEIARQIGSAKETGQFVDHIHTFQTLIAYRLLIGKLHETWKLFLINFMNKRSINKKYRTRLENAVNESIDYLKRYFQGNRSPLSRIRNDGAFHALSADEIEASFQALSASEPWHFYVADRGRSFYLASEIVAMKAIVDKIRLPAFDRSRSADEVALQEFCRNVKEVATQMTRVLDHCIAEICTSHLGDGQPADAA